MKWYFGKRALTLDYRDDYGRLLDPNLGAPANVSFGADGIGGEGLTVTPIKTVALWSGVVEPGMDGKAVIKLPAPDFNGELRLMAVAWTDTAVGSASRPPDRARAGGDRARPARASWRRATRPSPPRSCTIWRARSALYVAEI